MLKCIFQQVLKHLLRTKLPEKRPKRRITPRQTANIDS